MSEAGKGVGWERLAQKVAETVAPDTIDALWVFPVLRQDQREWGTAVLSRVDGDRRRIYTARYVLAMKGKERGKFEATVEAAKEKTITINKRISKEGLRRIQGPRPRSLNSSSFLPGPVSRLASRVSTSNSLTQRAGRGR